MKNKIENMYQESHRNMDDSNCLEEIWQAIQELKRMIEILEKEKSDMTKVYRNPK